MCVTHTILNYQNTLPNFSDFPTSALVSVCFLHNSVTLSCPPVKCWDIPKTDFDRLVSVCFLHTSVTLSCPPVTCSDLPKTVFDRLVSVCFL